ncbi:MAG: PQQ-dependent sugar dehydrogenase [Pseudomonadota bacterium]
MIRLFFLIFLIPTLATAQVFETESGKVQVDRMVGGLDNPWSFAFLPEGGLLITERDGQLLHISPNWRKREISGLPLVFARNQGGLFDVIVPRDYPSTGEILLTYAEPQDGSANTVIASARLDLGQARLEVPRVLFRMNSDGDGGRHFGGRLVEAPDGTLFLSTGDRGERPTAQEMDLHNGKIIRINRDGSIPADNPFTDGPTPEVWSLGHRNPQGLALDAEGRLWTNSHGARGGDEINLIEPGKNYGWPVISYGRHYTGGKIGIGTERAGLEQPRYYWDPSIAPSGMAIYSGKLWPEWEGDFFIGSLKFDLISRIQVEGTKITGEEWLLRDEFIRIRDIREGPEGALWFLAVGDEALMRITPVR